MVKKRKITNYKIENDKAINKRIVVLSDIHYYQKSEIIALNKILLDLDNIKPDYICIPGDLLDESYVLDEEVFIDWLKKLSKYRTFIVLGNHDIMTLKPNKKSINNKLFTKINNIKNIDILSDNSIIDSNIRFIGITLPYDYYYKYGEDGNYLIKYFKDTSYDDDKYNIMLCHSPIGMLDKYDQISFLKNIDLSIYGHTHGGLVPFALRKILKTRGIVNPRMQILSKDCYGYIKSKKSIISSGITKLSHKNPFYKFNFLFKGEIVIIDLINK